MSNNVGSIRRTRFSLIVFCLTVGSGVLSGTEVARAQVSPDMPRNLLSRAIPYEQGTANIEAQEAARPQAVQPVLPSAEAGRTSPALKPSQPTPPAGGPAATPR